MRQHPVASYGIWDVQKRKTHSKRRMASLTWDKLKSGIEAAFSSDRVDVDEVQRLMSSYHSDQEDWGSFARFDPHR